MSIDNVEGFVQGIFPTCSFIERNSLLPLERIVPLTGKIPSLLDTFVTHVYPYESHNPIFHSLTDYRVHK